MMSASNRLPFARRGHAAFPTAPILRVAVWCAFLVVISFTTADPDLWGHVRFGLDILRDANIHQVDAYSFASDRAWVNHEWGAEVITGSAFAIGGNAGLVALKMLIVGATLLLLNAVLRREGVDSPFARDGAAAAAIVITLSQAHHVRPQLFSLLLFAILLSCLMAARRGSQRSLWLLPAAVLPRGRTCTADGSWAAVSLRSGPAPSSMTGERQRAFWCAAAGAVSLIATLATPYGFGLWRFLQETVGFSRPEILEWQPVYAVSWEFLGLWLLAFLTMSLGIVLGGRENVRLERLLVCVVLAAASFKVARLLAFFGLASLFLVSAPICARVPAASRRTSAQPGSSAAVRLRRRRLCPRRLRDWSPFEPTSGICGSTPPRCRNRKPWRSSRISPRAHGSSSGSTGANMRSGTCRHECASRSTDAGRRCTRTRVQTRHFDFYFDRRGGATLPHDLAADYVWIPRILPAARRLRTDAGWTILYDGKQSVIFGRAGLPSIRRVASVAAATTPRIFPGP